MNEDLLREIANDYLVPFFSGARLLDHSETSSKRDQLVSFANPLSILFKISKEDDYRLILTRRQAFAQHGVTVPEIAVVRAFVDVVGLMQDQLETNLKRDLLSTFQRRVVARAIYGLKHETTILEGIDELVRWGTRLYEGKPISGGIGFRHKPQTDGIALSRMAREEFAAVLSNGYDTILEFDYEGKFITARELPASESPSPRAPFRQAQIADWTTIKESRVALTLNRLGEILVFRDEQLRFARRSGRWSFLTHEPLLKQMAIPKDLAVREAIYATCLDASFARTGACIGVVTSGSSWEKVIDAADRLQRPSSTKARALAKIVAGRPFHDLDRRLRLELTAIDGATILDHTGQVLAIGAIISLSAGSSGGGRLAAARALSKLGLGIKVSQDGGITGYRGSRREPVFTVL